MTPETLYAISMPAFMSAGMAIAWVMRGFEVDRLRNALEKHKDLYDQVLSNLKAARVIFDRNAALQEKIDRMTPERGPGGRFLPRTKI